MLDSTINSNNSRGISGQSLNAALNAILDLVEGGGGLKGGAITVLLPNDSTFDSDNESQELLENNIACYEALKNQTEPMLIFLKYLGASKPLSQVALRLRHLYTQGEGESFFAFGYPATYSNDTIIGGLALASDMYRLDADGHITKITYDGISVNLDILEELVGAYNHSAMDTGGATLSSVYLPRIYKDGDKNKVESLFGSSVSGVVADIEFDTATNILTVKGGWTHPMFGEITDDIQFTVDVANMTLATKSESVTLGGWATITGYKMTKIQ